MRVHLRRDALGIAVLLTLPLGLASTAPATGILLPGTDQAVSDDGPYTRHDGGTDQAIEHCGDVATDDAPDDVAGDGDVDSNDGGARRQGNEPTVAVDPTDPDVIVAGWNDYCQTDLGAGWMGLGFSTDGGSTWSDSTLPGYPLDDSAEGSVSPLKGRTDSGDPLVAFDNDGRLFVGGIAFNRAHPQNGSVFVATYGADAGPSGPSGQLPKDYRRTRIVGKAGTPALAGIFQDKPQMEVDRSTVSSYEDNVYVCWSKFQGNGRNKIYFARSTDHGASFTRGRIVSDGYVQGCDIAVEHDGDVYVSWRTFAASAPKRRNGMDVVRSRDGGRTFSRPHTIAQFTPYFPNIGGDRDCGDGAQVCGPPQFVFARVPLEPRLTADQTGTLDGVYATWNAVDPATVVDSDTGYSSAGPGTVGRSLVYVARSDDNGRTWSAGPVDPSPGDPGHQFFSDVDAYGGQLVAIWQDNRTDDAYSVQLPLGNQLDAQGRAVSSGTDVVGTYAATSTDGVSWTPLGMVSATTHQPSYEMFGDRSVPFQGDYNWVSVAEGADGLFAYLTWTDNREVVPGEDPRETEAEDGFVDGFDVRQCRIDLAPVPGAVNPDVPLARADAPYTGDNCGNSGGLDQDIYGARIELD